MPVDPTRPLPGWMAAPRNAVRAARRYRARAALGRRAQIAPDVMIGANARWLARGPVRIDRRVFIGRDFFVETDLEIGPDVLISSRVAVVGDDHPFHDPALTITEHARREGGAVRICGDNLIGHGTVIIGPAVIGRGTVVGAGSLVTSDLPENTVCVGRPAKPVRRRR